MAAVVSKSSVDITGAITASFTVEKSFLQARILNKSSLVFNCHQENGSTSSIKKNTFPVHLTNCSLSLDSDQRRKQVP